MLMLATIAAICVAPVARAEPAALTSTDFAGRWVSADKKLTLDVSRCGNSFCGVVVANGVCAFTGLRLSEQAKNAQYQTAKNREIAGQLRLAANTQPYGVRAMLTRDDSGALTLYIGGHTGGVFSPIRRSYDYSATFARAGDAACSPDAKTS
jgi:hypothetical protein